MAEAGPDVFESRYVRLDQVCLSPGVCDWTKCVWLDQACETGPGLW
jgi:hypothetical protein